MVCTKMLVERKLKYWDEEIREIKEISSEDFDDKLKDLVRMLNRFAKRLQKLGKYDLKNFEVSLSLKSGIFTVDAQGSIRLLYERVN